MYRTEIMYILTAVLFFSIGLVIIDIYCYTVMLLTSMFVFDVCDF